MEALEKEGNGLARRADVASRGMWEGSREAAIKDEQQVAAGLAAQRLAQGDHGPVGGQLVTPGVGGQEEAREVVLVIRMGQAVPCEVEEEPVWRRLQGGELVRQQVRETREGGFRVEEAKHLEALLLKHVGDCVGIVHGIEERRNTVGISVDADDDSNAALEAEQGELGGRGIHERSEVRVRGPTRADIEHTDRASLFLPPEVSGRSGAEAFWRADQGPKLSGASRKVS